MVILPNVLSDASGPVMMLSLGVIFFCWTNGALIAVIKFYDFVFVFLDQKRWSVLFLSDVIL